jgi:RimJ/RimL family protein N-acetyltransferase
MQPRSVDIPTLETERLLLRPLRRDDFESYASLKSDPDVQRFLGDPPWDRGRAWRHLAFLIGHWELRGAGIWALEHKETGAFVGIGGFVEPEGWPGFELAGALARRFWSQGYAFEAGSAALAHGFEVMNKERIISLVAPLNRASISVIERLGMRLDGSIRLHGDDLLTYSLNREAYEEQQRLRQHVLLAS